MVPCCSVPGSCPVAAPRDLVLGLGVRAAPARECTAEAACAVHDAQGVCSLGVVLFVVFVAVWYVVECGLVLLWASGCCLGLSNLYPSSCEHVTAMAGFGESWLFGPRPVLINHHSVFKVFTADQKQGSQVVAFLHLSDLVLLLFAALNPDSNFATSRQLYNFICHP